MKTNTETLTKNVILVGGDKGGVGKSATSRAIADYLGKKGVAYIAYDGDDTNPTFLRFFPETQRIHTKSVKGFEPLINNLESDQPCQLVDLGAGTSIMLSHFVEQTGFIDVARSFGVRIVFVFVLAASSDSIGLLKILADQYGDKISYVVARSNAVPGSWDLWEGSKTRKRILDDLGAVEITIPTLDAEAFSLADRYTLTWSVAAEDKRLPLACRSYVHRWLQKVFIEFDRVKGLGA